MRNLRAGVVASVAAAALVLDVALAGPPSRRPVVLCAEPGAGPGAAPTAVRFVREEVTLAVSEDRARVTGRYVFRNVSGDSLTQRIIFPFHVDSVAAYPRGIAAFLPQAGDTLWLHIETLPGRPAVALVVPVAPETTATWEIRYEQAISAPFARYVLVSTLAWGRPLEVATYRFVVPRAFADVVTWPEPDSVAVVGSDRILSCTRRGFLPRRDMVVFWRPP